MGVGAWGEGHGGYKIVTECLKMSENVKKFKTNSNNVKKCQKIYKRSKNDKKYKKCQKNLKISKRTHRCTPRGTCYPFARPNMHIEWGIILSDEDRQLLLWELIVLNHYLGTKILELGTMRLRSVMAINCLDLR